MSVRAATIAGAVDPVPRGPSVDWPALLPDVARRLLGDPPRATATEWRYGLHGSLSVHPARGTWHDFEANAGGGALDLVEHLVQTDKAGALAWLVDAGLIDPPAGPDARPARGNLRKPEIPGAGNLIKPQIDAPTPAPTADVAAAILAAAVPADDTPARVYLAARGTWPPLGIGPDLPPAVRWLPPGAWEHLPTWPGRDGRPLRLTPPADGVRSLRPDAPPVPLCGAVVFELARPGCAPDAVDARGGNGRRQRRPAERWRRTPGNDATGRTFEVAAPTGDPWPDPARGAAGGGNRGRPGGRPGAGTAAPSWRAGAWLPAGTGGMRVRRGADRGGRPASGNGRLPGIGRRPART